MQLSPTFEFVTGLDLGLALSGDAPGGPVADRAGRVQGLGPLRGGLSAGVRLPL